MAGIVRQVCGRVSGVARCARAILRLLRVSFAFIQTEQFWDIALPIAEIATALAA